MKAIALRPVGATAVALLLAPSAYSQTFTGEVAPILYAHCASCHRPGQIGGFSLLTYQDARPRAAAIARAVRLRQMPPWKPEPGHGEFAAARRLTAEQIATLERWARGGAPQGRPEDLPPAPEFPEGWRLGTPDLVVALHEPYTLAPSPGADVLRNFVIPIPVSGTRYVAGVEFQPGNARVVHHANLRIDRTGAARRHDAADPQPGFDGFIVAGSFPDGHFLGWTPGQLPPLAPRDMAWRLESGSDLVVQLHMQPTAAAETVRPAIGLFFTDEPPSRIPLMLRLGRHDIDIPAGEARHTIEDRYVLPVDVEVIGVQPHAHFRAKEVRGFAIRPDGSRQPLLYIKDWDFNWQDAYRYAAPVALPRGTTMAVQFTYDNSAANPRNPDRPPRRIRWGENSADEMGNLWVQVLTRGEDDRRRLAADFAPKVMADDAAGYAKRLEADPDNARLHEAIAAIDLARGQTARAVDRLRRALRIDPRSVEAHYNLGVAVARQGHTVEAIGHFERALQIDGTHVAAHANLGAMLRAQKRLDEAAAHLRRALALDADNVTALTNLGALLLDRGEVTEAAAHYRRALAAAQTTGDTRVAEELRAFLRTLEP